jgi:signal transduction histidine kinase
VIALFAGRAAWQLLELGWLQWLAGTLSLRQARVYEILTVYLHLAFGILVIALAGFAHPHYAALLLLPTIVASFRFGRAGLLAVVALASAAIALEAWRHFSRFPFEARHIEYTEEATTILSFVAVAIIVRLLVRQLRLQERSLQESLDALTRTRDRLVAEEKLAAIGRLSAAVAHEIRNPVAVIAGANADSRRERRDPDARDGVFRTLERETARLARVTEDFLTYARQKPAERAPTPVRVTLEYVAGLLRPHAETRPRYASSWRTDSRRTSTPSSCTRRSSISG